MQIEQRSTEPTELETLRDQIEAWRGMRPRKRSMSPALWSEAARIAKELGVYRVARALKLNFDRLKRHVGSPSTPRHRSRSVARTMLSPKRTDFVEVRGPRGRKPSGRRTRDDRGSPGALCTRLSIRGTCASADVVALIQAFRGRP
jgi:hypothetical protein